MDSLWSIGIDTVPIAVIVLVGLAVLVQSIRHILESNRNQRRLSQSLTRYVRKTDQVDGPKTPPP